MEEQQPRPKSRAVATTLLALLSLAALALAGYVFWRVEWANPVAAVEARWTDRFATLRTGLDADRTDSEAGLAARITDLHQAIEQQRDALRCRTHGARRGRSRKDAAPHPPTRGTGRSPKWSTCSGSPTIVCSWSAMP